VHEFSIARGVVDVALKHCDGRRVIVVNMRIGALRQVVAATLAHAFELTARGTICDGALLVQEFVPARLLCPVCSGEWAIEAPDFRCPSCDAAALVVGGRELEVESIEVEDPDSNTYFSGV
jgi:hydrogenase nickel incorporation protein HypA/HybF